jgi:RNA-binding protein
MPAPTNPKKRSLMGASSLRKALRAAGHHLQPIVQVGKDGLTERVLAQLSEALDHHELVKVKVGTESPEDRFEVADRFAEAEEIQVAQVIGRTILAYRKHARTPRFEPLDAADRARPEQAPAGKAPVTPGRA